MGFAPTSLALKASILLLNYTLTHHSDARVDRNRTCLTQIYSLLPKPISHHPFRHRAQIFEFLPIYFYTLAKI